MLRLLLAECGDLDARERRMACRIHRMRDHLAGFRIWVADVTRHANPRPRHRIPQIDHAEFLPLLASCLDARPVTFAGQLVLQNPLLIDPMTSDASHSFIRWPERWLLTGTFRHEHRMASDALGAFSHVINSKLAADFPSSFRGFRLRFLVAFLAPIQGNPVGIAVRPGVIFGHPAKLVSQARVAVTASTG